MENQLNALVKSQFYYYRKEVKSQMLGKEKRRKVHQIIELALDISQGKPDVFVNYSPHTQQLDVYVYEKGWRSGENPYPITVLYLQGELANKLSDFNKVIRQLKKLKAKECRQDV